MIEPVTLPSDHFDGSLASMHIMQYCIMTAVITTPRWSSRNLYCVDLGAGRFTGDLSGDPFLASYL